MKTITAAKVDAQLNAKEKTRQTEQPTINRGNKTDGINNINDTLQSVKHKLVLYIL